MTTKIKIFIGILVLLVVFAGVHFFSGGQLLGATGPTHFQKESFLQGLSGGTNRQFNVTNSGSVTSRASIFTSGLMSAVSWAINGGTTVTEHGCATSTWDPRSMGTSTVTLASATTTLALSGAALGDVCEASLSTATTSDVMISCVMSGTATATVALINTNTAATDYVTGTVRACYWAH